ncbi:hypothetical protein H1D32_08715 [Anaerobacillus sp. CMMVII]|uniref:hypothetical protein n=1 Tax=Anaerobacillus sp. CMMVII TaxID=2755588 RepID=UPI0021B75254|nr:hypothetical protein [Anaerobacillus sp. CMMVII]MCT8137830.1 hypothetical protein [Anaerobacillus sp. CMMVII]
MEDILKTILTKLDSLENGQAEIRKDQSEFRAELSEMRKDQSEFRAEQTEMRKDQSEMRKEIAFYYGSLMRKVDETKIELSSEIKRIVKVQQEHQNVLEFLNEKQ